MVFFRQCLDIGKQRRRTERTERETSIMELSNAKRGNQDERKGVY